jgi:hypothetical protein
MEDDNEAMRRPVADAKLEQFLLSKRRHRQGLHLISFPL